MDTRSIIVIGASAGGFAVLKQLVAALPANLPAALFVVWHMPPDGLGVLSEVLKRANTLSVADALDGEPIVPGRIYVAPLDHHLLVEPGRVRVTKGPKEHRFRPAIDPLFRSAAYGPGVIGVVLSGALDDGTAGLVAIKRHGGMAVVQDPLDAEVASMPRNAMRAADVDYAVPAADLAALLARLCQQPAPLPAEACVDDTTRIEIRIAAAESAMEAGVMKLGPATVYTCPDCHGVLLALRDGGYLRFRCHTGHAFSADSLLAAVTTATEDRLWSAVRSLDETILLLNHLGDHLAEAQHTNVAAMYYQHAQAASAQSALVRQALDQHQLLSRARVQQLSGAPENDKGSSHDQSS